MDIQDRVDEALKCNETLSESERYELVNLMKGMAFDVRFAQGDEIISDHATRLTAIIGFLQQSERISEDEEEELQMIVNGIEVGR